MEKCNETMEDWSFGIGIQGNILFFSAIFSLAKTIGRSVRFSHCTLFSVSRGFYYL